MASHHHDHHHNHQHGHDHSHAHGHGRVHGGGNERAVFWGFLLTFSFMIAEVAGGLISGSLALIADAGHMLTDAAALGLAWAGFRTARRQPDERRSFGYARFEVLAGLANAVTLFAVVVWICYEAVQRLRQPEPILAGPMIVVAVLGLLVNAGVFAMLIRADREHINIRGALIHVAGDLLGSVAAIIAAAVIYWTGWTPIDPLLSLVVAALIVRSAWSLLTHTLHILLEGAPEGIDVGQLKREIVGSGRGVVDVHHVHVWSLSSGKRLATLHVALEPGADAHAALEDTKARLAQKFGLGHATVQVESAGRCADEPSALVRESDGASCATLAGHRC